MNETENNNSYVTKEEFKENEKKVNKSFAMLTAATGFLTITCFALIYLVSKLYGII